MLAAPWQSAFIKMPRADLKSLPLRFPDGSHPSGFSPSEGRISLSKDEFPELKKLPSLWTRSYFYDTSGKVSTAKVME
jgi:REP element-mobilizing transposase RayT